MIVKKITPRGFAANCYAVSKDGKEALVIDPSQPRVAEKLAELGLKACHVLLTHCHFDHTMGVPVLQSQGAKVWSGEVEKPLFATSALYDLAGATYVPFEVEGTFQDGEVKYLCGLKITVLHTPGHTAGGVCYLIEDEGQKALFTGDTLFMDSIGRTDLPTGDIGKLRQSLRKLRGLEGDMPVHAGHGDCTTLQQERERNIYLREA